jgi:hypothetical protein
MRLWSIHTRYLDTKGLVALWREALLAKHVLEGRTKGYKNHPQLNRFRDSGNAVNLINQYLSEVLLEAQSRNYNFNKNKIDWNFTSGSLTVTSGQIDYEREHLLKKLKVRDAERFNQVNMISKLDTHPLFNVVEGEIENWEII